MVGLYKGHCTISVHRYPPPLMSHPLMMISSQYLKNLAVLWGIFICIKGTPKNFIILPISPPKKNKLAIFIPFQTPSPSFKDTFNLYANYMQIILIVVVECFCLLLLYIESSCCCSLFLLVVVLLFQLDIIVKTKLIE